MVIEDFIYEELTEGEFDYDFYTVYSQSECDDPYYPPYTRDIGMYKSKENAIKRAKDTFYRMAEGRTEPEDRKYGGVEGMYYIEGGFFDDGDDGDDVENRRKNAKTNKPLYIIYDKEQQAKVEARWKRMHGGVSIKSETVNKEKNDDANDDGVEETKDNLIDRYL